MIVKKYPFLADKLGTGIGSWEQAIKNHLKNKRKSKPQSFKCSSPQRTDDIMPKKVKKTDVGRIPEKPEGETLETCKEHVALMKKEMLKSTNRKMIMIKDLIELTFPFRRESILLEPAAIDAVIQQYPALSLISELKAEFGRVMDDKHLLKSMADTFKLIWKTKILTLARKKVSVKETITKMEEAIADNPENKSGIEETAVVFPLLMKKRERTGSDLLKICSDDESINAVISQSLAPKLVGAGDMNDVTPLYIVGEGKIIAKLNNTVTIIQAVAVLLGCYYIFNIEYPTSTRNVYLFLEAAVMNRTSGAKKHFLYSCNTFYILYLSILYIYCMFYT